MGDKLVQTRAITVARSFALGTAPPLPRCEPGFQLQEEPGVPTRCAELKEPARTSVTHPGEFCMKRPPPAPPPPFALGFQPSWEVLVPEARTPEPHRAAIRRGALLCQHHCQ